MTNIPPALIPLAARPRPNLVLPDRINVIAWLDPAVERCGFAPHHAYVELLWLPVVGPTAAWAYRRLAELARRRPDGAAVELPELATSIGVRPSTADSAPVQCALRRLTYFGLARWTGRSYAVRIIVPPLSQRQLDRLPARHQAVHRALLASPHPTVSS
jgi:hypothetical protein